MEQPQQTNFTNLQLSLGSHDCSLNSQMKCCFLLVQNVDLRITWPFYDSCWHSNIALDLCGGQYQSSLGHQLSWVRCSCFSSMYIVRYDNTLFKPWLFPIKEFQVIILSLYHIVWETASNLKQTTKGSWLWAGWSGDRMPVGTRFAVLVQTGPGAHPASCTMGTWFFPRVKSCRGVMLTPHKLLVPWSRKGRAIPLIPLWAVRPVQSLRACTRVHFTYFLQKEGLLICVCKNVTCLLVCV